jgi:hypothetical protein
LPQTAQWIAATIREKDKRINEMTVAIDKQADDLAALKQQIVNTVKSVSLLEERNE